MNKLKTALIVIALIVLSFSSWGFQPTQQIGVDTVYTATDSTQIDSLAW